MIKMRATGKETEHGIVEIVDLGKAKVARSFEVSRYPTAGRFSLDGEKFYQPYWGEKFLDIFGTRSLKREDRISTPGPLSKLAIDKEGKRAVGISNETNSVVIINLAARSIEKVLNDIAAPKDVILVNDGMALVCSYDRAKVYQIDLIKKEVSGEIETSPRPVRLIISPQKDLIVSFHQLSPQINLFNVIRSNDHLHLTKNRTLDLGEVIADGTFADKRTFYFLSPSKCRLFGLDFSNEKTFWAMRTGGVRPRGDVEKVLFVGE